MNNNDMNNLMEQFNKMLQNNEFPDELKNALNSFTNSSNSNNSNKDFGSLNNSGNNTKNSNNSFNDSNSAIPDIDINTILKMKQITDSMKTNKNDPRANLLISLKPYLKESRQKKVDQYIGLFGLGKAFEMFNSLGGENKNDI